METIFLDEFSQEVWKTTYKHHTDKTINDTLRRIAKAVAQAEKKDELKHEWEDKFYELLSGFRLCAGGRIIANAGTGWKGVTLMNCFVGPKPKFDQDSLEGIYSVLLTQAQTLKSEGGWGMNFSFIRPRGAFIHGIGVESPGPVRFMEIFDTSSSVITAGSGLKSKNSEAKEKIRKGAMMGVLDVWHPSIEEFITAKLPFIDESGKEVKRLQKFNISVNCSNEFMDRVEMVTRLTELKKLASENGKFPENLAVDKDQVESDLAKYDKWDLIFPDTKFERYKEEWDGNIALWKSKGYPFKVYKTVSVLGLWNTIMSSTYERNDPGILFLDRANETHGWNYGGAESHIAATNPCGEQCLPFGFVCNLASLNLTKFIRYGKLDFKAIEKYVPWAIRFLDNVNDITLAPLPQYEVAIREKRRVGLGIMGWGSALYLLNIRYGSAEAEKLKEELMRTITHTATLASIKLAQEKGAFKGCEPNKHVENKFWKQIELPDSILSEMKTHGVRNSALFSIQPTGNTACLANVVSGGCEPVFLPEFIRTVIIEGCPEELLPHVPRYWEGEFKETDTFKFAKEGNDTVLRAEIKGVVYKIDKSRGLTREVPCVDYAVRILKEKGEWNPKAPWAATTMNLDVQDHIRDMTGFGKWIDSSMSKTVNLPNNYPYESFKQLYLQAYRSGVLKGITTYRAGTMMNVLAEKSQKLPKNHAPKRPESLKAELHHFVIDGHKYYVAVGLYGEHEPYEVFTGVNETKKEIYIPKNIKTGTIVKHKRGKYSFVGDDKEEYELTNGHSNETASALSRMISCALRHGSDIAFIVHQLEKNEGPIVSFSKALARTLKKYIKEGTVITGEECPECKGQMLRKEGCATCKDCGYSKCV
jgi:ribonucleoside-diphosphate reductase alpha chain